MPSKRRQTQKDTLFHLYEMSRTHKSTETESSSVAARNCAMGSDCTWVWGLFWGEMKSGIK